MDWNLAIERNREALKRILAMLVAMAAITVGPHPEVRPILSLSKASLEGPCRAISTARSCACSGRPSPPRGGWSSSWRAGWW